MTTRIAALLGVAFVLTALLVTGGLCCAEAFACPDEPAHAPGSVSPVLPISARVLADRPASAPPSATPVVFVTVSSPMTVDPESRPRASSRLRI